MKNTKPFVSIVIFTQANSSNLNLCLKSVFSQKYPEDCFEVIVTSTGDIEKTDFNIKTVPNISGGFAGLASALKLASGDIIACTTSKCLADENWIQKAVFHLARNADIICGPGVVPDDANSFNKSIGFLMKHPFFSSGTTSFGNIKDGIYTNWLSDCNIITQKDVLQQIIDNNNSPDDFLNAAYRMDSDDFKIFYSPDVKVYWHRKLNSVSLFDYISTLPLNRLRYGKKRSGKNDFNHFIMSCFIPFTMILSIVLLLVDPSTFQLFWLCCISIACFLAYDAKVATKSLKVGILVPMVMLIILAGSSSAMLKEMFNK